MQQTAAGISAIDRESVHRICSGQVVLTLAVAVKELVENSLDAGATSIEVRTKEYGCECIEVVDNGSGVEERNFEGLTLKHHTSKIGSFEDVEGVQTFGFRGEALSSLCAMSKLVITTRHASAAIGVRLEFDSHGACISRTSCPRPVGTTVCVQQLFHTLPVRHKEFLRNSKKEFVRMLNLITAYALISTNVRVTCSNQTASGKRVVALSTNGNAELRENIADVFGVKQLDSLVCFDGTPPTSEICEEFGIRAAHLGQPLPFRVVGYVSSCALSDGRSTTDRQYYYVNGRPCELSKVARVVNETYRAFNVQQYPCTILNVMFDTGTVDVNVTPDKRLIFIEHEQLLLAVTKASLLKMYSAQAASVLCGRDDHLRIVLPDGSGVGKDAHSAAAQPAKRTLQALYEQLEKKSTKTKLRCLDGFVRTCQTAPSPDCSVSSPQLPPLRTACSALHGPASADDGVLPSSLPLSSSQSNCPLVSSGESCGSLAGEPDQQQLLSGEDVDELDTAAGSTSRRQFEQRTSPLRHCDSGVAGTEQHSADTASAVSSAHIDAQPSLRSNQSPVGCLTSSSSSSSVAFGLWPGGCLDDAIATESLAGVPLGARSLDGSSFDEQGQAPATPVLPRVQFTAVMLDSPPRPAPSGARRERLVPFSMEELQGAAAFAAAQQCATSVAICDSGLRFKAKIVPGESSRAEEELSAALGKDKFKEMEMVGQFNLGFIVARLQRDLFIVDQHASDEKYNFEVLQKTTVLKRQKLVQPMPLHLTAANEIVLMSNLDVFSQNGFEFAIDETALPTTRVKLAAQPVCKNWSFGKEDIDEMLFMLNESPGRHCRPTRVRAMFASRACRKSVMIGTALKEAEMIKLVRQLAELDHPWNCPHGRPTIRHIINLDLLAGSND